MWLVSLTLFLIYWGVILGLATVIITSGEEHYRTLSWLLVVIFVPVVGCLLYFLFGRSASSIRLLPRELQRELEEYKGDDVSPEPDPPIELHLRGLWRMLRNSSLSPVQYSAEQVEIFREGEEKFVRLFQDIQEAHYEIHVMYYIIADDDLGLQLRDLLISKVRQGIRVRVLYDGVGSLRSVWHGFWRPLIEAGGEVLPYLPLRFLRIDLRINHRNHRKIVIIDRSIGYFGGMNVARRYRMNFWRDTHCRIVGSAVMNLQRIFVADWAIAKFGRLEVPPYLSSLSTTPATSAIRLPIQFLTNGHRPDDQSMTQVILKACALSRKEILIQTPYLLPPDEVLKALCTAAMRGVKVQIMIPQQGDSRMAQVASNSYLTQLMEAGIEIWRYHKGFLHSKTMVIDGIIACIGSANMDFRSLEINMEIVAFIYDTGVARELQRGFEEDRREATRLTLEVWNKRPLLRRVLERIMRLFSPLL